MNHIIKGLWRRFLESSSRRLIVIIGTFGIGLMIVCPAVDEYLTLRNQRKKLEWSLVEANLHVKVVDNLEAKATQQHGELVQLRNRTVSQKDAPRLRSRLVEMTRESGCQLRRVQLDTPRERKWYAMDHPLKRVAIDQRGKETPYQLQTQTVRLSVTGSLAEVKRLLATLHATKRMIHTRNLSLRSLGGEQKKVQLDLELILFDLEKDKPDTV